MRAGAAGEVGRVVISVLSMGTTNLGDIGNLEVRYVTVSVDLRV